MNLVQKLPVALGLAGLMMMSSCSKEDVQVPEPIASHNTSSNTRGIGGIAFKPIISPTYGPAGLNLHPDGWERDLTASNYLIGLPSGTSTLTHLFGNEALPWDKPLPAVPGGSGANSILTTSSNSKVDPLNLNIGANKRSAVKTKIKNLTPGKVYQLQTYVSTTVCKMKQNNYKQVGARFFRLSWIGANGKKNAICTGLSALKIGTWVALPLTFTAESSEQVLAFEGYTKEDNEFTYAHIFVDYGSLTEVNN